MPAVPNNTTFNLNDVIAAVGGTQNSLQDCVDDAISGAYNPSYYSAPATSMLEFRDYEEIAITKTISVSPRSETVYRAASSSTVAILSNSTWLATDNASWITVSGASNSGDDPVVTITFTENTTGNNREGIVTFTTTGAGTNVSTTYRLTQLPVNI